MSRISVSFHLLVARVRAWMKGEKIESTYPVRTPVDMKPISVDWLKKHDYEKNGDA